MCGVCTSVCGHPMPPRSLLAEILIIGKITNMNCIPAGIKVGFGRGLFHTSGEANLINIISLVTGTRPRTKAIHSQISGRNVHSLPPSLGICSMNGRMMPG